MRTQAVYRGEDSAIQLRRSLGFLSARAEIVVRVALPIAALAAFMGLAGATPTAWSHALCGLVGAECGSE